MTVTAQVTKSLIFTVLGGHDTFLISLLLKELKQLRAAECLRHVDLVIEAKSKFLLASESSDAENCSGIGGGAEEYLEGKELTEAEWSEILRGKGLS